MQFFWFRLGQATQNQAQAGSRDGHNPQSLQAKFQVDPALLTNPFDNRDVFI